MKLINKLLIIVFAVTAAVLSLFSFDTEISELDIVNGVAMQKQADKWQVLCEISTPSKDGSSENNAAFVKGEGFTIFEAFDSVAASCDGQMYMDSVQLYLVPESLKGDAELYEYFLQSPVNMRAAAVYVKGDVHALIKKNEPRSMSIPTLKKIQRFCEQNKQPVPEITEFLKNECSVLLKSDGTLERISRYE